VYRNLSLCMWFCEGLSTKSNSDVVGELNHGHPRITRSRYRAPLSRASQQETVRSEQVAHLKNNDQEHCVSFCLSDGHRVCHPLLWYNYVLFIAYIFIILTFSTDVAGHRGTSYVIK